MSYVGRFAPSPSGDLHFGSLVAAVASYLQAKTLNGKWLVRIEDIDPPREVPGSAMAILSELKRLGMKPDGDVLFQSSRLVSYRRAWEKLLNVGQAFFCGCSRGMLPKDGIHRGHCRADSDPYPIVKRVRFLVNNRTIRFKDRIMGHFEQVLSTQVGDFVIRRPEGWPAYHLAVVIDDAYQEITEIVRGSDLLDSTSLTMPTRKSPRLCAEAISWTQRPGKSRCNVHSGYRNQSIVTCRSRSGRTAAS
jgi:glutamyl-Q tRNA(Asp) synthetase